MNLPFRAIISDLDGTLLNTDHRLSQLTIKTLEQLNQLGVEIFLATGRNYPDVKHIVAHLKLNDATLITSNGARSNNLAGNLFSQHYIPEILVTDIFRSISFDPSKVCLNSYQGDNWFINKDIPELKILKKFSLSPETPVISSLLSNSSKQNMLTSYKWHIPQPNVLK